MSSRATSVLRSRSRLRGPSDDGICFTPDCFKKLDPSDDPQHGNPFGSCRHLEQFFQTLFDLYDDERFCDVVVEVERVPINAHRIVLAASSPFFYSYIIDHPPIITNGSSKRAASNSSDKSNQSTPIQTASNEYTIHLHEVKASAAKTIIKYMYTRKLEINESNAFQLYLGGRTLGMDDVTEKCSQYLIESMTEQNVFARLEFGTSKEAPAVRDAAIKWVATQFWRFCFTSGYFRLEFDVVRGIISSGMNGYMSEDLVYDAAINWIQFSANNRRHFFQQLFSLIQLPFMSQPCLTEVIADYQNPLLDANRNCKEKLREQLMKTYDNLADAGLPMPRGGIIYAVGRPGSHFEHFLETYDPIANMWKVGPKIENFQFGAEMKLCSIGSSLYMIGDRFIRPSPSSMNYDVAQDQWLEMPSPSPARIGLAACSIPYLEGIAVVGGFTAADWIRGATNTVQLYRKSTGCWQTLSPMLSNRKYCAAVNIGDKVFAIGGLDGERSIKTVETFSIAEATERAEDDVPWALMAPMLQYRYMTGAVAFGDRLYVAGGYELKDDPNPTKSVEFFDFDRQTWYYGPSMTHERANFALVASGGSLYAVGGHDTDVPGYGLRATVERYDPRTDRWVSVASLIEGKGGTAATTVVLTR